MAGRYHPSAGVDRANANIRLNSTQTAEGL